MPLSRVASYAASHIGGLVPLLSSLSFPVGEPENRRAGFLNFPRAPSEGGFESPLPD